jgi:uncharacterized protein YigE (DUF2233 family)
MHSLLVFLLLTLVSAFQKPTAGYWGNDTYHIVRFDPKIHHIQMFWKNSDGELYSSVRWLWEDFDKHKKELVFACNGGMFMEDLTPLGLFIENGKQKRPLNTRTGYKTNFYIQPNGVFFILTDGSAHIITSGKFSPVDVQYATQSGGMLVVDGKINPAFDPHSTSHLIRNAVGIDQKGMVYFVLSKKRVNFYDFASEFVTLGCTQALFLDGDISNFFLPDQGVLTWDCYCGVIIGVVK